MNYTLNQPVKRYALNPILTAEHVNKIWENPAWQVITVHNAGVIRTDDDFVMLFRSHLRNGISVIGLARSKDGITNWQVAPKPALFPATEKDHFGERTHPAEIMENEAGGVEDPRICRIGDTYYITYSAYHGRDKDRVRVSLITTQDFSTYLRWGAVLQTDMRNVVIFPEKISGKYVALFRPNDDVAVQTTHTGGVFKQILIGYADTIEENQWDIASQPIIRQGGGPSCFSDKIGPGATPIKTRYGWINIFHGVRGTMDGNPYCLGVALHDLANPAHVQIANIPILMPSKADCRVSEEAYVHVPNVVFCCGAVRLDDGTIYIYYGGNDTVMNLAYTHEDILAELCRKYPQNPADGTPAYLY